MRSLQAAAHEAEALRSHAQQQQRELADVQAQLRAAHDALREQQQQQRRADGGCVCVFDLARSCFCGSPKKTGRAWVQPRRRNGLGALPPQMHC